MGKINIDEFIAYLLQQDGETVQNLLNKMQSSEIFTTSEKEKLKNIAEKANNYVHPNENGTLHVPKILSGDGGKILKASGDEPVWDKLTAEDIEGIETTNNKNQSNGYAGLNEKSQLPWKTLPDDIVEIRKTRNLFDVDSITYPGYLDETTGEVKTPTFEGKEYWLATDFIPVEYGKSYALTRGYLNSFERSWLGFSKIAYYTKDYEYISGEQPAAVSLITPPENASYMRIGFYSSLFANYDLKYAKYMIFEVNENWKDEEITGAFYVPYEKIKVDDEPEVYDKDYYSYSEVLTEGYLPNPDSGVNIWSGHEVDEAGEVTNDMTGNFHPGQVYVRGNWSSAYDEENSKYSFTLWERAIKQAIELKTRAQVGVFGNLYPYYDTSGHVEIKTVNGEEAAVCYMFPKFVFDATYEADEYPLRLIRYAENTYEGLPLYNAVIDWRNTNARTYYQTALEEFASFLENNEYKEIKYKDAVSAIQIRFWGKWGEGHNVELYDFVDLEDSETLKGIVDIYINTFPDIRLIAPITSAEKGKTIEAGHSDFKKYYYEASNNAGKFGFFIDHVGSCLTQQYPEDYDGLNIKELVAERYKVAPITGEVYNCASYDISHITLPWLVNDVAQKHFSTIWFKNVSGLGKTPNYKYISTRNMFRTAYDMTGYRLFFLPICNYAENNVVNVQIRVGNMGVAPVYADYWNAQLVIRDTDGNEHVIDNVFDVRDVPLMPDVLTPSWKDCRVISVKEACRDDVDYTNATYYIRIVDTKGISDNMYLANIGRTEDGEYNLVADCSEDSTLMEDDTLLESENIKEHTLLSNALKGTATGAVVVFNNVSPVEHKVECVVRSKNLLRYPYYETTKTVSGITFTDNGDGSITINGTATANVSFVISPNSLSNEKTITIPKGSTITLSPLTEEKMGVQLAIQGIDDNGKINMIGAAYNVAAEKITNYEKHYVYLYVSKDSVFDNLTVYPKIEIGRKIEVSTDWVPYVAPDTAKVNKFGKNLFATETTTVNGTAAWKMNAITIDLPPGKYVVSADFVQSGAETSVGLCAKTSEGNFLGGASVSISATKTGRLTYPFEITDEVAYSSLRKSINFYCNATTDALDTDAICVFKNIQIEFGDNATDYEAYVEPVEYTPNAYGTVNGMTSISPNMSITIDTENTYVDVVYNRDINKAFEEMYTAIISLGGNI